ncbi:hypothetical protein [Flavobacterium sp.]|uniref:hypothetical protein n=1 Tax=Flavobacterium sp. TaxID=239 RepID=UPI003D6C0B22
MQDEILKHSRKIYKSAKDTKHTFWEKAKEILLEVCIIVFAVTLSIWLHSWSEHKHEQKEANKFLIGLKNDLKGDIEILKSNKNSSIELNSNYKFLQNVSKSQSDSIIGPHTTFYMLGTAFNNARYEGFKSSGKIETIENDSLKNAILLYYQQTIPNLTTGINYLNSFQLEQLKDSQNSPDSLSLYTYYNSKKLKSMLHNIEYNAEQSIFSFDKAINQAEKIMETIDNEAER